MVIVVAIVVSIVAAVVVLSGGSAAAAAVVHKRKPKHQSSTPDSHHESSQSTPSSKLPKHTQVSSVRSRQRNLSSKNPSLERTKHMQVTSVRDRHSSLLTQGVTKRHSQVLDPETAPNLDCIVIPSFGDSPPRGAVAKKRTDFLPGVATDLNTVQQLIEQDTRKKLSYVRQGYHDHQTGTCKELIENKMEGMKLEKSQNGRKCTNNTVIYFFFLNI